MRRGYIVGVRRQFLNTLCIAAGSILYCGTALAHHSRTQYDQQNPIALTGTITAIEFVNPHIQIHFDVKGPNDEVAKWTAEGASPQQMLRRGWDKNSLKAGDVVKVSGFPARDGRKIMDVERVVAPNGKEFD